MELERPTVNAGEKIPAKPRNQNCQRTEACREERNQKNAPVMETKFQHAAIASAKFLEAFLKALLESHERVATAGTSVLVFFPTQQVLRHGRDDGPRQKIRSQHGKHHRLCQWHKQISSDAGE